MPKIFLVSKGTLKKEYRDALIAMGNTIKKFESLNAVLPRFHENPDLLIIDRQESERPALKKLLKLSRTIPKIIISATNSNMSSWIKEPFTYGTFSPGAKELSYLVNRSLRERKILYDNSRSMEGTPHEESSKNFSSSTDLNTILDTIMKRAKKLTGAETWTVFLVDEGTGELVFERTEGRKTKETQKSRLMNWKRKKPPSLETSRRGTDASC